MTVHVYPKSVEKKPRSTKSQPIASRVKMVETPAKANLATRLRQRMELSQPLFSGCWPFQCGLWRNWKAARPRPAW